MINAPILQAWITQAVHAVNTLLRAIIDLEAPANQVFVGGVAGAVTGAPMGAPGIDSGMLSRWIDIQCYTSGTNDCVVYLYDYNAQLMTAGPIRVPRGGFRSVAVQARYATIKAQGTGGGTTDASIEFYR